MKKILTAQQKNKKDKRNQTILVVFLGFIMVFSTLAYALNMGDETENPSKINYKGIEFLKNGEYWQFNFNGLDYITRYNPQETENISFNSQISLNTYENQALYFSGDLIDGHREIAINLDKRLVLRTSLACLENEECNEDYPLKNCDNDNIIIFKNTDDKESIYKTGKCVYIITKDVDQILYADKFLFKLLGLN